MIRTVGVSVACLIHNLRDTAHSNLTMKYKINRSIQMAIIALISS